MEYAAPSVLVVVIGILVSIFYQGMVGRKRLRKRAQWICRALFDDLVAISPVYRRDLSLRYSIRGGRLVITLCYKGTMTLPEALKELAERFLRSYAQDGYCSVFKTISVTNDKERV